MKSGVVKTIKLFIGGEFVRSESGNSFVDGCLYVLYAE